MQAKNVNAVSVRSLLLTVAIGFAGALAATAAGLPAAPLVGASVSVSAASLFGCAVGIPAYLCNVAFAIIGCSLGSGITRQALAQSASWSISILVLSITVLVILVLCSWVLCRVFGQTVQTAVLATAPGALAYSLAIAASGVGDIRAIMVVQNIRLLLVTALLPFVLDHLGFQPGTSGIGALSMTVLQSLTVIALAVLLGMSVRRWRIAASYLLAGMLVSGLGHFSGLVEGRPPAGIIFIGFTVTGSMVGARFFGLPRASLRKLLLASLVIFFLSGLLTACFAIPLAYFLNLPPGQVFTAFAPGGVEAMAAMALALGYDPTFVAVHHLFRILFLYLVLPAAIRVGQRKDRNG